MVPPDDDVMQAPLCNWSVSAGRTDEIDLSVVTLFLYRQGGGGGGCPEAIRQPRPFCTAW